MKKFLKISLIAVSALIVIVVIVGFIGWKYLNATFLDFEKDYVENTSIKQLTIDGYTFSDRNGNGELDVYEDHRQATAKRVDDLLSQMTIDEKIHILKGSGMASATGQSKPGEGIPGAVGTIVPTPRLGLPTVYLSDGPAGLRIQPTRQGEDKTYYCTAFPIATLLGSTWNEQLLHEVGDAMGNEAVEYGIDVILGPGANIHRHPFCGRNFEYFSEDPVLTGNLGAAIINGIEANGVGTSVKHYVANNQETDRNINDVIVSERAMREIYLKGFEIIVRKSQPWTIMSSYNKVNGTYTSENKYLLSDVLRDDWGFEGLVMTDWFGGKNATAQIKSGNDLLEPGTKKQWKALLKGYENGDLSEAEIDVAAGRILALVVQSKKMQNFSYSNNPDLKAHAEITRRSAAEGIVLLKNQDALPIRNAKNVALLGVTSYDFIAGGTGSGDVNEAYTVSLEEGLKNVGFEINQHAKNVYEQHKTANAEAFVKPEGFAAMAKPFSPPEMAFDTNEIEQIVGSSDVGILTIGRNSGEGGDRVEVDDFLLSSIEKTMIDDFKKAFEAAGKKLVVVLNIGGVIETDSWKNSADAIVLAWQGGQEGGNSVADILSGKVNPSGKLPMTFPVQVSDHASHKNFPLAGGHFSAAALMNVVWADDEKADEDKVRNKDFTIYEEGVYVGYRHFDKNKISVSYPFGYGLSYTKFECNTLNVSVENDSIKVAVSVKNTGDITGKEVLQVYTEKLNSSIDRPTQELKAFAKTTNLEPGDAERIELVIPLSDLSYWHEENAQWQLEKGKYNICIGTSSRDIKHIAEIEI